MTSPVLYYRSVAISVARVLGGLLRTDRVKAEVPEQSFHEDLRQVCVRMCISVCVRHVSRVGGLSRRLRGIWRSAVAQQRRHMSVILQTSENDV